MSEWKKVKLGEITQIIDGDRGNNYPKNNEFSDNGYCLFLNTGNVTKEGFSFESNQFISKEKDELLRKGKVQRGDLVLTTRGTVGNVAYYNNNVIYDNVRINSGMVILRVNEAYVSGSFLYQLIRSNEFRTYIKSICTGSAQPQLPIKNLSQISLTIPPIENQIEVSIILTRYDSLIENYQKQIKLLEEAAQRLYKEWFIDLRFPGHENTKIVDGVPKGWEKKKVGEVCDINKTNIPKEYKYDYIRYTDLGNVREGTIQESVRYDYGQEPGRAKRIAKDGDTIWGMVRPNLKSFALVQNPQPYDVYSTGFAVLSPVAVPFTFLYCALTTDAFVGYLVNCTNGAAYPAVKAEHFKNAEIIIPHEKLLESFHHISKPIFRKIKSLSALIRLLTEARDRLLPKLMNGEISAIGEMA